MARLLKNLLPLLVEIKAEACKDEGEERHKNSNSDGAAVGGTIGFGVREGHVLSQSQA